jgi:hypothetical protein
VADSLVIPRRFNGPPDSGHGGYSAGLAAGLVEGTAEVRLLAPPPLDAELHAELDEGAWRVRCEDTEVMRAAPAAVDLEIPDPVTLEEAEAGARSFIWDNWHPFPTCFGCGPDRKPGDALRLFAGPVPGRDLFGCPWTPAAEFAGPGGGVDPLFVWAALDCPGGAVGANDPAAQKPIVLASMAVQLHAPVAAGEPHAIGSWRIATEGRKRFVGVALWDAEESLRASARALWIELRS